MTPIPSTGVSGIGPARRSVLAERGLRTAFDVLEADEREHEPWEQLHGIGREGWEGLVAWARAQRVDAMAHQAAKAERNRAEEEARRLRAREEARQAARAGAQEVYVGALRAMDNVLNDVEARRLATVPPPDRAILWKQEGVTSTPERVDASGGALGCLRHVVWLVVFCVAFAATVTFRNAGNDPAEMGNLGARDMRAIGTVLLAFGAGMSAVVLAALTEFAGYAIVNRSRTQRYLARLEVAEAEYARLMENRRTHERNVSARVDLQDSRAFVASLRSAGVARPDAVPLPSITFDDAPDVIEKLNAHYLRALEASRAWQAASAR